MSKISKGDVSESQVSLWFHQEGVGVLVSSLVLRSRGCGQVDVARIIQKDKKLRIQVGEVKSSVIGKNCVKINQRKRLLRSLELLAQIFSLECELKVINSSKRKKSDVKKEC